MIFLSILGLVVNYFCIDLNLAKNFYKSQFVQVFVDLQIEKE